MEGTEIDLFPLPPLLRRNMGSPWMSYDRPPSAPASALKRKQLAGGGACNHGPVRSGAFSRFALRNMKRAGAQLRRQLEPEHLSAVLSHNQIGLQRPRPELPRRTRKRADQQEHCGGPGPLRAD